MSKPFDKGGQGSMHVHIATDIEPLRVLDIAGSSRLLAQSAKQRGKPSAMPELPWMVEGHTATFRSSRVHLVSHVDSI